MTVFELEACIKEHGTAIYSFCLHLAGMRERADELYQDTFLVAMEHIGQMRADENPKSYLLSVAVRLWKNRRRKAAWRSRIAPEQPLDAPQGEVLLQQGTPADFVEAEVLQEERRRQVRRAVAGLPEKYRMVVLLFYMEEQPLEACARILRIPTGTVKSRLHQARKLLKEELEVLLYE